MYTHQLNILRGGTETAAAEKALILVHGRGASAEDILELGAGFSLVKTALLAPQATHRSWYPYSFIMPEAQNQPALDSAIGIIRETVEEVISTGIPPEKIVLLGFSQGACLTLEFAARHAQRFGGIVAFTGGLIGQKLNTARYTGDFAGTPVLITTGDPDTHVPLQRVHESDAILQKLGAKTDLHVYPGRPHTITQAELALARKLIENER